MSELQDFNLTVLGTPIAFRAGANIERVENAKALLEERYAKLKSHGGQSSKETLLTFLVLGLADDLLQSHKQLEDVQNRINLLLNKIENNS